MHKPVLLKEVIEYLNIKEDGVYVDATIGYGGHAKEILKKLSDRGLLIGIDCDSKAISSTEKIIGNNGRIKLFNNNFCELGDILKLLNIKKIDGMLFDLGVSYQQLQDKERGFSFNFDSPLDMRMDERLKIKAADILNNYKEEEINRILKEYANERKSGKIAKLIVEERKKKKFSNTYDLLNVIRKVYKVRPKGTHIHPATKVFMALRIVVNDELNILEKTLPVVIKYLDKSARILVISFHSGEDRIVKNIFKELSSKRLIRILTKKPVTPTDNEIKNNRRARSAKLRVAEKI